MKTSRHAQATLDQIAADIRRCAKEQPVGDWRADALERAGELAQAARLVESRAIAEQARGEMHTERIARMQAAVAAAAAALYSPAAHADYQALGGTLDEAAWVAAEAERAGLYARAEDELTAADWARLHALDLALRY